MAKHRLFRKAKALADMDEMNSAGSRRLRLPRMTRLWRRLIVVIAGLLAAAGITVVTAPAAQARAACTTVAYFLTTVDIAPDDGVPAASGYVFADCDLAYGASGAAVRSLQRDINSCYASSSEVRAYMAGAGYSGWTGLAVDGQFGNMTKNAVKAVQNFLHIGVDGSFGPITRNAMTWAWTSGGGQGTFGSCSRLMQPLVVVTFNPGG